MKKLLAILGLLSIVFTTTLKPQPAKAADDIMHLYGSVFMAMAAGIDKDFALAMGVGNEMIDRGYWTTPMGLPTPRLLFHFLGTPADFNLDEGIVKRGLAIATIKHPLFYNMLHKGLQTKNPVDLGKALHLLIDTFYHAGYSNMLGHGEAGHRPDMPYEEVQKARLCFQAMMEVMFMIRDMQPGTPDLSVLKRIVAEVTVEPIYFEKYKKITGAQDAAGIVEVLSRRPDLFTNMVLSHEQVRNAFFTNMERTPQYRKISMREIFTTFIKNGYTTLKMGDLAELSMQFRDIAARTDISPAVSLKIVIYRVLQLQDPVLEAEASRDLSKLGYDPAEMKKVLARGKFNFAQLGGYDSMSGLNAEIESNYVKNQDALKLLTADLEVFIKRISTTDAAGKVTLLKSSDWPMATRTMGDQLFLPMLEWTRIINHGGAIRLQEHRDIGNLFSTQTNAEDVISNIDRNPEYLLNTLEILKSIEADPGTLKTASRLKALAEMAYYLTRQATKDNFPSKTSADNHVVFEDDKLAHALFAKEGRVLAQRNLLAEFFNIDITRGPDSFHTFMVTKLKAAVVKLRNNPAAVAAIAANVDAQIAETTALAREFNHEIGFGTKDTNGKLTLPIDRPDVIRVAPNLSLAGYISWTVSTFNYAFKVMVARTATKNAKIMGYVSNGERIKTAVSEHLWDYFYNADSKQKSNLWNIKYGGINTVSKNKYQVTGLSNVVSVMSCQQVHIRTAR